MHNDAEKESHAEAKECPHSQKTLEAARVFRSFSVPAGATAGIKRAARGFMEHEVAKRR
jgi:hypothetical protein